MSSSVSEATPIDIVPGVLSDDDAAAFAKFNCYTAAQGIRFYNGKPKKIGGWLAQLFEDSMSISGKVRSIFSCRFSNRVQVLLGSHLRLYNLSGSQLTNVTPLLTTTTVIANAIDTHYATLGANPIATTNGSNNLVITDSEYNKFQVGDSVTISGAVGFAGILAANINGTRIIRSIGSGNYTVRAGTAATSTTTGGGGAVVRSSGLLTFDAAAHAQLDGDRVKIALAADTGGILAADINAEFIIRNVTTNTFDVMTDGTATSSVSNGGGAATTYQKQIPAGAVDESFGQGYGMGLYGAGLYGVSKTSSSGRVFPRIWFFDRFADTVIMTPGEQGGVYQWDGSTTVAPALLANAPTAVNYVFVFNGAVVTLGAGGVVNKIFSSDINAPDEWTSTIGNYVFEDDIEGADRFTSHLEVGSTALLFTDTQTYTFRFIDLPDVWEILPLDKSIGIAGPMARVTVNGTGYWMGVDNFYMWDGGNAQPIPSNVGEQSTILRYVFDNFNRSQKSKCFAWYNKQFNEIWFHYPSLGSNEPDRIARYNVSDRIWVPDVMDRTAAEYPVNNLNNPLLISSESVLYKHELGNDADTEALPWSITSPLFNKAGRNSTKITGVIPDSIQTGNINLNIKTMEYPQWKKAGRYLQNKNLVVSETRDHLSPIMRGRYWQYEWSGEVLGQEFQMGVWQEEAQAVGKI
jgi:hypothetical protein